MERKKNLNIWLLVLSLITIITILLPFADTLSISEDLSLWIKIVFYGTISIFIACLAVIAVIALLCLIKDNYEPIKFIEFCVLLGFFMVFINIIVFACSSCKLTIGYAIMALEAFIMSAFSQSGRLFSALPNFGKDLLTLFKKGDNSEGKKKKEKKQDKKIESEKSEVSTEIELPEPEVEAIGEITQDEGSHSSTEENKTPNKKAEKNKK